MYKYPTENTIILPIIHHTEAPVLQHHGTAVIIIVRDIMRMHLLIRICLLHIPCMTARLSIISETVILTAIQTLLNNPALTAVTHQAVD